MVATVNIYVLVKELRKNKNKKTYQGLETLLCLKPLLLPSFVTLTCSSPWYSGGSDGLVPRDVNADVSWAHFLAPLPFRCRHLSSSSTIPSSLL